MNHFTTPVDRRSRLSMIAFLSGHYRYHTMNSWNGLSSYANNIKVTHLGLSHAELSRALDVLQTEYWSEIDEPIQAFTEKMGGNYTICVNGRSSGYLVLHESHYETTGHLSVCQSCGQRNFKACGLVDGDNACGRCHAVGERGRRNFASPPQQLSVANCGIDTDRDFSEWSISQLKERVELVIAFDEACEEIRSNFISLLSLEVIEETVFVPQKVFVLRERQAA